MLSLSRNRLPLMAQNHIRANTTTVLRTARPLSSNKRGLLTDMIIVPFISRIIADGNPHIYKISMIAGSTMAALGFSCRIYSVQSVKDRTYKGIYYARALLHPHSVTVPLFIGLEIMDLD